MFSGIHSWWGKGKIFLFQFLHLFHLNFIFPLLEFDTAKNECVFLFEVTEINSDMYIVLNHYVHLVHSNVLLQIHPHLCAPGDPKPLFDAGQLQTSACTAFQLPGGGGTHQSWLNPGSHSLPSPAGGIREPQVPMVQC